MLKPNQNRGKRERRKFAAVPSLGELFGFRVLSLKRSVVPEALASKTFLI